MTDTLEAEIIEPSPGARAPAAAPRPPVGPPKATGSPSPAPAADKAAKGARGPGNNWLQPVVTTEAVKPADYDHSRPADDFARLGYKTNGDPWSPYGTTELGKVRRRPVAKDSLRKGGDVPAGDRRLAPGDQKPPEDVKALYAALDDSHTRQKQLVAEIRKLHPDTKIGPAIHPKETGDGTIARVNTDLGPELVEDGLKAVTNTISKRLGPDAKPSEKSIKTASQKVSEATKYWGIDASPRAQATFAAVVALVLVFLPAILCALDKLLERLTTKRKP